LRVTLEVDFGIDLVDESFFICKRTKFLELFEKPKNSFYAFNESSFVQVKTQIAMFGVWKSTRSKLKGPILDATNAFPPGRGVRHFFIL
jgi:hypothetical protein